MADSVVHALGSRRRAQLWEHRCSRSGSDVAKEHTRPTDVPAQSHAIAVRGRSLRAHWMAQTGMFGGPGNMIGWCKCLAMAVMAALVVGGAVALGMAIVRKRRLRRHLLLSTLDPAWPVVQAHRAIMLHSMHNKHLHKQQQACDSTAGTEGVTRSSGGVYEGEGAMLLPGQVVCSGRPGKAYVVRDYLGGGSYGFVYAVERRCCGQCGPVHGKGQRFALKVYRSVKKGKGGKLGHGDRDGKREQKTKDAMVMYKHETVLLRRLHHPRIITYVSSFVHSALGPVIITHPVCSETLKQRIRRPYDFVTAIKYLRQMGEGLEVLTQNNIFYADLAPRNALITHDDDVVLTDLGASYDNVSGGIDSQGVEKVYSLSAAPELVSHTGARMIQGEKADVFSLGVCAYVMLSGRFDLLEDSAWRQPHQRTILHRLGLVHQVPGGEALVDADAWQECLGPEGVKDDLTKRAHPLRPHLVVHADTDLFDLVSSMLRPVPELRPTVAQVVAILKNLEGGAHAGVVDVRGDEARCG